MANYNITELTINHIKRICLLSGNGENIIKYFISDNLNKLIGKTVLEDTDAELMLITNDKNHKVLNIDYIYSDHVSIEFYLEDEILHVDTYLGNELASKFTMSNTLGENKIIYQEDVNDIIENKKVVLDKNDAKAFYYSRCENDEVLYEGKLVPVMAAAGHKEFFDFREIGTDRKEEKSLIKRVVDSISNSSLVAVNTSLHISPYTEYLNNIFEALKDKLETTREKKTNKVRVRKTN